MSEFNSLSIWEQIDYIRAARQQQFFKTYWQEVVSVLETNTEAQNETMYSGIPTNMLPELLVSKVEHVCWFARQELEKRKEKVNVKSKGSKVSEVWKQYSDVGSYYNEGSRRTNRPR